MDIAYQIQYIVYITTDQIWYNLVRLGLYADIGEYINKYMIEEAGTNVMRLFNDILNILLW